MYRSLTGEDANPCRQYRFRHCRGNLEIHHRMARRQGHVKAGLITFELAVDVVVTPLLSIVFKCPWHRFEPCKRICHSPGSGYLAQSSGLHWSPEDAKVL